MGYTYKRAQHTHVGSATKLDHVFFSHDNVYDSSISVDECSFSVSEPLRRGWSRKGTRVRKGKVKKGDRLSLILAIDRTRVVACKVVQGGVNASKFRDFVAELPHHSRVILDNASIHKARVVRDTMHNQGIMALHPPPYSPWFNPIEMAFSWLKRRRRRDGGQISIEDLVNLPGCNCHFDAYFNHCQMLWSEDVKSACKLVKDA